MGFEQTSLRGRNRIAAASTRFWGRIASAAWLLVQGSAAATVSWVIAKYALGHPEPFFAPVAAVIALNTTLGERGLQAIRLLYGVVVGILTGELGLLLFGHGYGTLGLATFTAMAIAYGVGGARVTVAQAAVGAILTIAVGSPEAGVDRFVDALVGAGVALIFTQVLFSPEPVALVRRAETAALGVLADGLGRAARGLEEGDEDLGEKAMENLRNVRDLLVEVNRMQRAGSRVSRRSLAWRSRRGLLLRENENAGHLDPLGVSCLMLARIAPETSAQERRLLAPMVRRLAQALTEMSSDPGDRQKRQAAAEHALGVARQAEAIEVSTGTPMAAAVSLVRITATDVMTFAGLERDQVLDAVRQEEASLDVPTPPPPPRSRLYRQRRDARRQRS